MAGLLDNVGSGKRKTRYRWPQAGDKVVLDPYFYDVLLDCEPMEFRVALLRGDYKRATDIYTRAETHTQWFIMRDVDGEDRYVNRAIRAFYEAEPKNPVACVACGRVVVLSTFSARYDTSDDEMTDEIWDEFMRQYGDATQVMEAAQTCAEADPLTWRNAISLDMLNGGDKSRAKALWEAGCRADADSFMLHNSYLYSLEPIWGGSFAQMDEAVDAIVAMSPKSHLESLYPATFMRKNSYRFEPPEQRFSGFFAPVEHDRIRDAYARMRPDIKTLQGVEALNRFAACFWQTQQEPLMLDALERLKHRYVDTWWSDLDDSTRGPADIEQHRLYLLEQKAAGLLEPPEPSSRQLSAAPASLTDSVFGLFRKKPTKVETRYNWPTYRSVYHMPTTYENFLADDEPGQFSDALLRGDGGRATRIYEGAEACVQEQILNEMNWADADIVRSVRRFYLRDRQNPVACLAKAWSTVREAWIARSSKSADQVEADQWAEFQRILDEGAAVVAHAQKVAGHDVLTWAMSITYNMGTSGSLDDAKVLWERGCRVYPLSWRLNAAYYTRIEPKWGGSFALTDAAVTAILRLEPGSHLMAIRSYDFQEKAIYASMCDQEESTVYLDPAAQQLVIDAYQACKPDAESLYGIYALNHFAYSFWCMERHDYFLDAMKHLRHRYTPRVWPTWSSEFDEGPRSIYGIYHSIAAEHRGQ